MNPTDPQTSAPSWDEISPLARQLWERAGQPSGRDHDFWFEAESLLRQSRRPSAAVTVAPAGLPGAPKKPAKPTRRK